MHVFHQILACHLQNNTFYTRNIQAKMVLFAKAKRFKQISTILTPFIFPHHYSHAETHVFHQLLTCSMQNNTFYTSNLIHAKIVLFTQHKNFF